MPQQPAVAPERPSALKTVSWTIKDFRVSGTKNKDKSANVNDLQAAFVDYLQAEAQLGPITSRTNPIPAAFELEVSINITRDTKRTGVLDIVNVMAFPLLWGALTPEWGTLGVTTNTRILNAQGKLITTIKKHGSATYSMTFFSWYRSAAIERAFSQAYTRAFRATSEAIAAKVDEVGFEAKKSHRQGFVEALLRPLRHLGRATGAMRSRVRTLLAWCLLLTADGHTTTPNLRLPRPGAASTMTVVV